MASEPELQQTAQSMDGTGYKQAGIRKYGREHERVLLPTVMKPASAMHGPYGMVSCSVPFQ